MRRAAVVLAMLVAVRAFAARMTPVAVREQGRVRVALPRELLADPDVRRGLASGLTTGFVLDAELGAAKGHARIEVRYELWDEVYLVRAISFDKKEEKVTLASLTALEQWWGAPHVAVLSGGGGTMQLKLEVLPFSASEEADAKKWLAQSARSGAPPVAASAADQPAPSSPSLLDAVIGTSVRRKPLLRYVWRVGVSP